MLRDNAVRACHECGPRMTPIAVQRSIRLEGDAEEHGERSLRVAGGQAKGANRWHASHSAIVWRRSKRSVSLRRLFCGHAGVGALVNFGGPTPRSAKMWCPSWARPAG